ncbi:hypothetical protein U9M48_036476 [Paspalum notatum var. saurae]|uniref:Uncharacterized protein n=1 Tax=Paspalum notatum var. saurae TaxID=547442 RepID=A0AAQ3UD82_PASNO
MGRRWTEGISRDDRLTSYPTATGPDIQFAVCLCARYQASPKTSHHQAVKRIFRGFSDADHAGCQIDRKSTSAKNPVLHSRTKHIDVRFHFLRDHYEKGDIDLVHVASENQLADIFTKPLEFGAFVRLRGSQIKR